jgi:hypothetical protein
MNRLRQLRAHLSVAAVPVAFGPKDGPADAEELALIKEVEEYNTPQITNVVATYPAQKTNIGLVAMGCEVVSQQTALLSIANH